MNEHIDIFLTSAKVASINNLLASNAMHTISMTYIISMIGQCGYQSLVARMTNYGYVS